MYDKYKVIAGMLLFLGLATLPFWLSAGKSEPVAKPVVKENTEACVESVEYMRANHMQLLDEWRHSVVREGERTYVSKTSGKHFNKSLTKTCLDCHSNKEAFCDTCHKSVGADLYCFSCHLEPGGKNLSALRTAPALQALADRTQPAAAGLAMVSTNNPVTDPIQNLEQKP